MPRRKRTPEDEWYRLRWLLRRTAFQTHARGLRREYWEAKDCGSEMRAEQILSDFLSQYDLAAAAFPAKLLHHQNPGLGPLYIKQWEAQFRAVMNGEPRLFVTRKPYLPAGR